VCNRDFSGPVVTIGRYENMTVVYLMLDDSFVLRDDGFYNRVLLGVKTRKAYPVTLLDCVPPSINIRYIYV